MVCGSEWDGVLSWLHASGVDDEATVGAFEDHEVDTLDTVSLLDPRDLDDMGIRSEHVRAILIRSISALKTSAAASKSEGRAPKYDRARCMATLERRQQQQRRQMVEAARSQQSDLVPVLPMLTSPSTPERLRLKRKMPKTSTESPASYPAELQERFDQEEASRAQRAKEAASYVRLALHQEQALSRNLQQLEALEKSKQLPRRLPALSKPDEGACNADPVERGRVLFPCEPPTSFAERVGLPNHFEAARERATVIQGMADENSMFREIAFLGEYLKTKATSSESASQLPTRFSVVAHLGVESASLQRAGWLLPNRLTLRPPSELVPVSEVPESKRSVVRVEGPQNPSEYVQALMDNIEPLKTSRQRALSACEATAGSTSTRGTRSTSRNHNNGLLAMVSNQRATLDTLEREHAQYRNTMNDFLASYGTLDDVGSVLDSSPELQELKAMTEVYEREEWVLKKQLAAIVHIDIEDEQDSKVPVPDVIFPHWGDPSRSEREAADAS
eukprot:NODE_773_length_1914_cov_56.858981_g715_i0.p1 GENE.NODE_773_length_1914_cov_56.858981_g715_i0~~NODE_773_length_1914_cov_56.858981_g715_i0.p1  ORF type:complete len:504 (-),score=94.30 NODE_773_length_1914_cov_56.858981_g715_i0:141-1652(-)